MKVIITTTINSPTKAIEKFQALPDWQLIVIGDKKTPKNYNLRHGTYVPLETQMQLPFKLAKMLPINHYARKNIGYLYAFEQKTDYIYETDDDNAPLARWKPRSLQVDARVLKKQGWVNAYRYFTNEFIWPRGFPLDCIKNSEADFDLTDAKEVNIKAPIQQGLADNSPDVDATWRLLHDKAITFNEGPAIYLKPGAWCPFNSQSTWWWPQAYPLMYLPSFCSFRMTDIWRSFIAQRCLWEIDSGVVFHASEVYQDRNDHNLMRDFEDEIPGYLGNKIFVALLENLSLKAGVDNTIENLLLCYEALIREGFFPKKEISLVKAWTDDIERII